MRISAEPGLGRRELLRSGLLSAAIAAASSRLAWGAGEDELVADVVIIGGGLGGCAAALAATRAGMRVVMTEPTDWVGGQLTSQGVPPDENRWIESAGSTASYRALRAGIRDLYRRWSPLTAAARQRENLNPGNGWVSRLCVEPVLAHAALEGMLAPAIAAGRLTLLPQTMPVAAELGEDRIAAIWVQGQGRRRILRAPYFLDATEEGDLYPLAGIEHVLGAESRDQTGEPHALDAPEPETIQAVTWCCAVAYEHGEDFVGSPPPGYQHWSTFVPELSPPWPGRLLSHVGSHPITLEPRLYSFVPTGSGVAEPKAPNLFTYRRIVDPGQLTETRPAVTVLNQSQNDYLGGNLIGVDAMERARHLEGARNLTRCLVHWLQTEAPRPDGGQGWPGLRLDGASMGTSDGLAKAPYVREPRRLLARTTVLEQHVSPELRMEETGADRDGVRAHPFPDSVGIGQYRIDLHPTPSGRNYLDVDCLPFQIPLGALLPRRVTNLLAAGKGIGTTHITNGSYRLHPVEWNIGEAAGALAAHCLRAGKLPHQVHARPALLEAFQAELREQGFLLDWPT